MNDKEFLKDVKDYIERMAEAIDGEWGKCRDYKELIEEKLMPNIYYEVLSRLENYE